jgi:hypothetical protein
MLSKLHEAVIKSDKEIASSLADLCYNIGQWALSRGEYDLASKWLESALKIIPTPPNGYEKIDPDTNNLRLVVLHALGKLFHHNTMQLYTHSL